jgi:hypothetical protein
MEQVRGPQLQLDHTENHGMGTCTCCWPPTTGRRIPGVYKLIVGDACEVRSCIQFLRNVHNKELTGVEGNGIE